MAIPRVRYSAEPIASHRVKGRISVGIGLSVVIASLDLDKGLWPILDGLYMDGEAGSDGELSFEVRINGQRLPYDWAKSDNPIGEVGNLEPIGQLLQQGGKLEIVGVSAAAATQAWLAYCHAEVLDFDAPNA